MPALEELPARFPTLRMGHSTPIERDASWKNRRLPIASSAQSKTAIGRKPPGDDAPPDDEADTLPPRDSAATGPLVETDRDDTPYSGGGRIKWTARSLRTSAGVAAEEKRHGADLMGILDIDIPNYRVIKGFLSQAKRAEPGRKLRKQDWDRLHSQCEKMLLRTPDAFVWVYSISAGIRIFPAVSVLALKSRDIFDLYSRSISSFFEYHIECFIGDQRLNSTDIETLEALADFPVETVLELSGRP